MPKRKRADSPDLESICRKIKLLERQVREKCSARKRHRTRIIVSSSSSSSSSREPSPDARDPETRGKPTPMVSDTCDVTIDNDLREILDANECERAPSPAPAPLSLPPPPATPAANDPASTPSLPAATPADNERASVPSHDETTTGAAQAETIEFVDALDSATLEILGEDPAAKIEYGPSVHKEIASRFEHFAVTGIDKELRKELGKKYLTPGNCVRTGAPILNDEIRAALPENIIKRDKIIQAKQKQLATVISCVANTITEQLNQKEKNHDLLQKLMDMGRLLCDIQHKESLTRRNFSLFSVKKEMKDHLTQTNIDKHLFGDNLSEALKAAKAVNKSVLDLKVPTKAAKKSFTPAVKPQSSKNWKYPAPARRQPGPPKSRETFQREPPSTSSKRSPHQSKTTRRR